MDVWVQNSQLWLNSTYGSAPGYITAPTDGYTGWDTMYSLITALQIELGIYPTADTFGPTTLSELTSQYGNVSSTTTNDNLVGVVQCALWCKGYWGDTTIGDWTSAVSTSVLALRADMGIDAGSSVTPKMFKSLLTMDAYIVIGDGTSEVRTIQRWLNGRYKNRADYYIIPCDGLFSRDVQRGLMLAIQYEIGMADGVANGYLGSGTKSGLTNYGHVYNGIVDTTKRFVHLFQAALIFNGFAVDFDGDFGNGTEGATTNFQTFVALPTSGEADFQTWASLLVSTGDVDRPGTAVDCVTTITNARALTLIAHGYQIVGRYLTNYPEVGALDKKIKPGELTTIFSNGLKVFPIFQVGGDDAEYFSWNQGYAAAKQAYVAARAYGFKAGTTIYFAVDFDALEEEVWDVVVPHFEGIAEAFLDLSSDYSIGIYGARNTCAIVSSEGLAELSFVSGMSTGYSGNLGYPLPSNWAFDQILEYSIGEDAGAIAIDKDIASGRDAGQDSLRAPSDLINYVSWLRGLTAEYVTDYAGGPDGLVMMYLRQPKYDDLQWTAVLQAVDPGWISFVDGHGVDRIRGIISPGNSRYISADHLAAAMQGRFQYVQSSTTVVNGGDMTGWAGDLAQVLGDYVHARRSDSSLDPYDFAMVHIARPSEESGFGASDFDEDIDAVLISDAVLASPTDIDDVFASYYSATGGCVTRYSDFLDARFGGSTADAYDACVDALISMDPLVVSMREGIWSAAVGSVPPLGPTEITNADIDAFATAFVDVLIQKIDSE